MEAEPEESSPKQCSLTLEEISILLVKAGISHRLVSPYKKTGCIVLAEASGLKAARKVLPDDKCNIPIYVMNGTHERLLAVMSQTNGRAMAPSDAAKSLMKALDKVGMPYLLSLDGTALTIAPHNYSGAKKLRMENSDAAGARLFIHYQ